MITEAEAKTEAARLACLALMRADQLRDWSRCRDTDWPAVEKQLDLIFRRLQREVAGGDKILRRQLDKELGRQVHPTAKQAKRLGLPE